MLEFDRCAKKAGTLLRFHDGGLLDQEEVLKVLRRVGVIPTPARPGAPPAPPSKPFPVPVYSGSYRWPLEAGVVSSEFGPRRGGSHDGIDIAADLGVPVHAAADGEVIYAGAGLRGYGNVVILRHDEKMTTLYSHNKGLRVKTGEGVGMDQVIAHLGSTGRSTGPHLHFEVREADKPLNPRTVLPTSRF